MYSLLLTFLDQQQALLITLMLISIPISYILSILRNKYMILGLSVTFSVIFQLLMFPTQYYILWSQQIIVYILLRFAPRKNVGKIILIQTLIHLCAVQIRRMYISYAVNGVDITGILMMQTFLYVGLGYNYQNGLQSKQTLTQGANKRKVVNLPDPLTYIGYVFFLPSCLVGPCFQFRDFQDYINQKGDYVKIPNTLKPALKQLGTFVITLIIYVGTMSFNIWDTVKPQFAQHSYLYKLFYIGAVIFHIEFKYITAWSLGMISVHCSGLSYSGKDQNFDKIQVTKIIGFFLDPSLKIKIQCWNMPIQTALKRYIYDQIYNTKTVYPNQKVKKKIQGKAQLHTLLVSALWHGLYPGYFVSFLHWMIYLRMTQELYRLRKINAFVDSLWTKYKFHIVQGFLSDYILLYFGIFFHVMTWANIKAILFATYGIPFFILYGLYFIIYEAEILSKSKKNKWVDKNSQNKSNQSDVAKTVESKSE